MLKNLLTDLIDPLRSTALTAACRVVSVYKPVCIYMHRGTRCSTYAGGLGRGLEVVENTSGLAGHGRSLARTTASPEEVDPGGIHLTAPPSCNMLRSPKWLPPSTVVAGALCSCPMLLLRSRSPSFC
jgi:hypothetical protein